MPQFAGQILKIGVLGMMCPQVYLSELRSLLHMMRTCGDYSRDFNCGSSLLLVKLAIEWMETWRYSYRTARQFDSNYVFLLEGLVYDI
jgi:hypothetical protein